MKLLSQNLEFRALRTIAVKSGLKEGGESEGSLELAKNQPSLLSSQLIASIDASFFEYEPCKAAFNRLMKVAEKRSRILDYNDLIEDPTLDEEFRDILRENQKPRAKSKTEVEDLVSQLDNYRKTRVLYEQAKTIIEKVKGSKVDADELIEYAIGKISQAQSRENLQDKIFTMGKEGNALGLIDEALSVESETLYPTGYEEFDKRNGGWPTEGVMLLAGTTSGGKSVLRMNLAKNFYLHSCLDVLTVSLEMSAVKETRRHISMLTGIEFHKISKRILSQEEREKCKNTWKRFHKFGKKNKCRYSIFAPTRGLTIQQLLMLVKPFKYKVIFIDYVSLLDGVDEKDQWKALSAVVRQCKIFSTETKCLVVLLAQLDSEDDRIRYSKGMLEHADGAWIWNYSKAEQRDLHQLPIKQAKARDQELFPFELKEEFHIMRVSNNDSSDSDSDSSEKASSSTSSKKEEEQEVTRSKKKTSSKKNVSEDEVDGENAIQFEVG